MQFNYTLTLMMLFISSITIAQDKPASPWKKGGDVSVTFFQSSFTNWTLDKKFLCEQRSH